MKFIFRKLICLILIFALGLMLNAKAEVLDTKIGELNNEVAPLSDNSEDMFVSPIYLPVAAGFSPYGMTGVTSY